MQFPTIAFYKGRHRLFDRLVQWWTRGPYSHCELVIEQAPNGMFCCISSSWCDGGVRAKWMFLPPERWDIVDTEGNPDAARQWGLDHAGKRYDLLGLFGFVWRARRDNPHRWFCSEAVAAILGFPEPWRFSPNDLSNILKRKGT